MCTMSGLRSMPNLRSLPKVVLMLCTLTPQTDAMSHLAVFLYIEETSFLLGQCS